MRIVLYAFLLHSNFGTKVPIRGVTGTIAVTPQLPNSPVAPRNSIAPPAAPPPSLRAPTRNL